MFFDEEMLLDLRLNIMDKYVDKFVITEATYMHSGKSKKLMFDINKFSKFKDKIIYNVVDKQPTTLESIDEKDSNYTKGSKLINNSVKRENYQRDMGEAALNNAEDEDIVLSGPGSGTSLDDTLLGLLKDLRKRTAIKLGLPPFVIFQDPSLEDMGSFAFFLC